MRPPTGKAWYGPWPDDHVDRPEVYAQQCVQPTGTNRPRAWDPLVLALERSKEASRCLMTAPVSAGFPVAIAARKHPFPFRTRKLSSPAPMVLGGRPPGRVGRRREISMIGAHHCNGGLRSRLASVHSPIWARHRTPLHRARTRVARHAMAGRVAARALQSGVSAKGLERRLRPGGGALWTVSPRAAVDHRCARRSRS